MGKTAIYALMFTRCGKKTKPHTKALSRKGGLFVELISSLKGENHKNEVYRKT